jgi:hypothetical protein
MSLNQASVDNVALAEALFLALCRALGTGWRSAQRADGTRVVHGFFAGVTLPGVGDIRVQLPAHQWDHTRHLRLLERAPAGEDQCASDVCERVMLYATLDTEVD